MNDRGIQAARGGKPDGVRAVGNLRAMGLLTAAGITFTVMTILWLYGLGPVTTANPAATTLAVHARTEFPITVPSGKPIDFSFAVPLHTPPLHTRVDTPVPGQFAPVYRVGGQGDISPDTKLWRFFPGVLLPPGSVHEFRFAAQLFNDVDEMVADHREVRIAAAEGLRGLHPPADGTGVPVYTSLSVTGDPSPARVWFQVRQVGPDGDGEPIAGRVEVQQSAILFHPLTPLQPQTTYRVAARGIGPTGEPLPTLEYRFTTTEPDDQLWVDVRLSVVNQVTVYQGTRVIRSMIASVGKPGDETPPGTYRIQNRGKYFWSQKYGEGAYYWVRFLGNYLFHSVPVDEDDQVKPSEKRKLGCPASHGCVRLAMPDAQWFYETVPDGTLVIIRP